MIVVLNRTDLINPAKDLTEEVLDVRDFAVPQDTFRHASLTVFVDSYTSYDAHVHPFLTLKDRYGVSPPRLP
jgi:hypothetical protein